MVIPGRKRAAARPWADIELGDVEQLLDDAASLGWDASLGRHAESNPFFVQRLRGASLGNWHALLQKPRTETSLDIGCGFGALLAGFARWYRVAFGAEMLPERLRFSALRQSASGPLPSPLTRASGHALPFRSGVFDLVTMNGVLEWAAYYSDGPARRQQVEFLREARRLLTPGGTLAVAIENRYALENLVGMRDTHTGLRFIAAMPRLLADLVSRLTTRRPYRTWLYSRDGYRQLFRAAGFGEVAVLDLVSSYNDWDFVVDPADAASYQFLWSAGWVKSFFPRARSLRHRLSRTAPRMLGHLNYAYLVLGGAVVTLLDAKHPLWERLGAHGITPGNHRVAFRLREAGGIGVLSHDGSRAMHALLLSPSGTATASPTSPAVGEWLETVEPGPTISFDGVSVSVLRAAG